MQYTCSISLIDIDPKENFVLVDNGVTESPYGDYSIKTSHGKIGIVMHWRKYQCKFLQVNRIRFEKLETNVSGRKNET